MEDLKDIALHKLDVKISRTQQMIACVTHIYLSFALLHTINNDIFF